jgi:arylsulfatase A-like enzyme
MLAALDDAGIADRTVVVFTSEHGDQMGEHGIFHKLVMYEPTIQVPMLVRVPWLSGGRIPGRYSHIDTVPTLLDLLGASVPASLQGRSRADVLRGTATLDGNHVVIDWNGRSIDLKFPLTRLEQIRELPHRTIISPEGWKLSLAVGDQCELYDMASDPHETVNRFEDPDCAGRVVSLARKLRAWQLETGDTAPLPDVFPGAGYVADMR